MKAPTFTLPEGVMVPDGKKVGDTFAAMTTYKLGSGGKVTLEAVDGEPLDGADDESDTPNESANDDTTQAAPSGVGGLSAALMGGQ